MVPSDGQVNTTVGVFQDSLAVTCNDDFRLNPDVTNDTTLIRTCLANGQWSLPQGTCCKTKQYIIYLEATTAIIVSLCCIILVYEYYENTTFHHIRVILRMLI